MGLGIRGWRLVGLGICKVGGVGSRSNHAPWILCSAVDSNKCSLMKQTYTYIYGNVLENIIQYIK